MYVHVRIVGNNENKQCTSIVHNNLKSDVMSRKLTFNSIPEMHFNYSNFNLFPLHNYTFDYRTNKKLFHLNQSSSLLPEVDSSMKSKLSVILVNTDAL